MNHCRTGVPYDALICEISRPWPSALLGMLAVGKAGSKIARRQSLLQIFGWFACFGLK